MDISRSHILMYLTVFQQFLKFTKKMNGTHVYNLGLNKLITVRESIKILTKYLNLNPVIKLEKQNVGGSGDSPKILFRY